MLDCDWSSDVCSSDLMEGLNHDTVWTWNAIGKRSGAWNLAPDAPEAKKGFLLNHLISELLPRDAQGKRITNSDPITGQAAWFDLRVRIEKCAAGAEVTEPQFPTIPRLVGLEPAPTVNSYGASFHEKARDERSPA
jgi:hypothetical protein